MKTVYALSYTQFPQVFSTKGDSGNDRDSERVFCEDVIKVAICRRKQKFYLTGSMSKTRKKFPKLLQNLAGICYNAYTINNRKG